MLTEWCHPRDHDKQTWVLIFEDEERPRAVYYDEAEARAAFDRAEAMGWNCNLFASVRRAAALAAREPVAWPTDKEIKAAFDIVSKDKLVTTHLGLVLACLDLVALNRATPAREQDERKGEA
jgi:hypothetical protein